MGTKITLPIDFGTVVKLASHLASQAQPYHRHHTFYPYNMPRSLRFTRFQEQINQTRNVRIVQECVNAKCFMWSYVDMLDVWGCQYICWIENLWIHVCSIVLVFKVHLLRLLHFLSVHPSLSFLNRLSFYHPKYRHNIFKKL